MSKLHCALCLNSTQAVHLSMLFSFGWYDLFLFRYTICIWVYTLHSDMLFPYLGMLFSFGWAYEDALFIWACSFHLAMPFSFGHAHLGMLFSFGHKTYVRDAVCHYICSK